MQSSVCMFLSAYLGLLFFYILCIFNVHRERNGRIYEVQIPPTNLQKHMLFIWYREEFHIFTFPTPFVPNIFEYFALLPNQRESRHFTSCELVVASQDWY